MIGGATTKDKDTDIVKITDLEGGTIRAEVMRTEGKEHLLDRN